LGEDDRQLTEGSRREAMAGGMTAARSWLFTAVLVIVTAVMGLVFLPAIFISENAARPIIKMWAKALLFFLRLICGIGWKIENPELRPSSGAIVAANHQSMWETIALFALLPKPAMVYKKELLKVPVYGWWVRRAGVTVDRDAGASAIRALRKEAQKRLARGEQIVIFPEGTRGPPGGLQPLLPGVAGMYLAAEAPVTPAAHDSGEHWRHPGVMKIPGDITLKFLPAIPPGLPRRDFMETLEGALAGAVAPKAEAQ
jgi:1-acyl-sn-glycerol-3-phosphate acyltransferase